LNQLLLNIFAAKTTILKDFKLTLAISPLLLSGEPHFYQSVLLLKPFRLGLLRDPSVFGSSYHAFHFTVQKTVPMDWLENLGYQLIFSSLMLIMANGLTTVAEETLTSSLTSLISATSPIVVFLGSVAIGLQKFTFVQCSVFSCVWRNFIHLLGRY
jgi:drug/metabolite transporter (DMT)-like permease